MLQTFDRDLSGTLVPGFNNILISNAILAGLNTGRPELFFFFFEIGFNAQIAHVRRQNN